MIDWRPVYLHALGAKVTPAALDFLAKWQPWEGGATKNNASNNYFNTTEDMPGARSINSVGVKAYPTLAIGARAFAKTLLGRSEYAPLVQFLRTGKGDPTPGLSEWLSGSPDSPHGLTYAAKILGSSASHLMPTAPDQSQGVTPDAFAPPTAAASAATGAAQIRSQAVKGFGDIATGGDAVSSFGDLSGLLSALHSANVPTIHPATMQAAAADPGGIEAHAVKLAQSYMGVKYTWGGTNAKTGFDCSGLLYHVWGSLGVKIPRTSEEQWAKGTPVDLAHLKPGDAIFTEMRSDGPGHVGMYIGNGKIIAAPHTGTVVQVQNLSDWKVAGARRFA